MTSQSAAAGATATRAASRAFRARARSAGVASVSRARRRKGSAASPRRYVASIGKSGRGPLLELFLDLVELADADERVATHEVVVEERERESGDEGVYPDGETRELDCRRVDVHAVDTTASDQPAKELGVLDFDLVSERPERLECCGAKAGELRCDGREPSPREVSRQRALDPVDRGNEKVTGAHRDIGNAEVEEALARLLLAEAVEAREMIDERGFERSVE